MEGSPLTAMLLWLGPTDMATIFVIALLLFGPDQLPKVARQVGEVMRHMQNTTQSFMLEMDRAAREHDVVPVADTPVTDAAVADALSADMPSADEPSADAPSPDMPSAGAPNADVPNADASSAAPPSAGPPSEKPPEAP
jgi:Sec-independent protein translocase protein TatA